MADQELVERLRAGAETWNRWRQADLQSRGLNPAIIDLQEADLTGEILKGADLTGTFLRGADLTGADLTDANLSGADLRGADLSEVDLRGARLYMANLDASAAGTFRRLLDHSRTDSSEIGLSGTNLSRADLRGANLQKADFRGANLSEANLEGANLSEANLTNANLDGCRIFGVSAWNVRLEGATQTNLRITPPNEPEITVDNLEVAQFLYLLLNNEKARAVLDTITSKVVLILGRFSIDRKPNLDALREALRNHPNGYIPMMFDFEPQADKPVFETVKILANLARFVIADLTDPNMVRSELSYITANVPTVPVQPVVQEGAGLPTEYSTWVEYRSFLPLQRYTDLADLLAHFSEKVVESAEGHVVARRIADAYSAR
jgi:uncharacterized protein YjbI with pentapeptide repeats